jgi:hypothetical protein
MENDIIIDYDNDEQIISVAVINKNMSLSKEEALALSIKKWQAIVDYLIAFPQDKQKDLCDLRTGGASKCALCWLFIRTGCYNCPITRDHKNRQYCYHTPYVYFEDDREHDYKGILYMAQKELKFLQSLEA